MECSLALKYQDLNGARCNMYINNGRAFTSRHPKNFMSTGGMALLVIREGWAYSLKSRYWS